MTSSRGSSEKMELVSFDEALQNKNNNAAAPTISWSTQEEHVKLENNDNAENNQDDLSASSNSLDNNSLAERSLETAFSAMSTLANHCNWRILLFGQGVSFATFAIGASASELVETCQLNAPIFQFAWSYFLLSLHLVYRLAQHYLYKNSKGGAAGGRGGKENFRSLYAHEEVIQKHVQRTGQSSAEVHESESVTLNSVKSDLSSAPTTFLWTSMPIYGPWWAYFIIAFLEVEANFFTILAFRYTTFTSVTLLDSLAIPASMFASRLLLQCKYGVFHLVGVCMCLLGSALNVLIDIQEVEEGIDKEHKHKVVGDIIAIIGAILIGVNDTLTEYLCKKYSPNEFLAMFGFYGSIICIVQMLTLELGDIAQFFNGEATCSTETGFSLLFTFALAHYLAIIGQSHFLVISEAALMNLSMLTSDLFSVIFSVFFEGILPNRSFYIAMVLIMTGIVTYELGPSPMTKLTKEKDEDDIVHEEDVKKSHRILNVFEIKVPNKAYSSTKSLV